jgi:16S rRNA (uracil1498-N3)-methyltransferase
VAGPEGGWAADEVHGLVAIGAVPVALGPRTLRADVVPVVALAALFEAWRGW